MMDRLFKLKSIESGSNKFSLRLRKIKSCYRFIFIGKLWRKPSSIILIYLLFLILIPCSCVDQDITLTIYAHISSLTMLRDPTRVDHMEGKYQCPTTNLLPTLLYFIYSDAHFFFQCQMNGCLISPNSYSL